LGRIRCAMAGNAGSCCNGPVAVIPFIGAGENRFRGNSRFFDSGVQDGVEEGRGKREEGRGKREEGGGIPKVDCWYQPFRDASIARNIGFSAKELGKIQRMVREHRETLQEAWNAFFNL